MPVGLTVSKGEIDERMGQLCRNFQRQFEDTLTMWGYLTSVSREDLEAMGYTPSEIDLLQTAAMDLFQLSKIWSGQEALPAPKDFRYTVRKLWGIGAF